MGEECEYVTRADGLFWEKNQGGGEGPGLGGKMGGQHCPERCLCGETGLETEGTAHYGESWKLCGEGATFFATLGSCWQALVRAQ